jgi:acyl-CoA thioester hydrolase
MPPFVHRLRVRYNECDAQGHVFNANYFVYVDVTLTEFWREAFGSYDAFLADGLDLVVAEAGARFRSPARFDDELEITLEVERLGNTSMTSAIAITRDGDALVEGRIVHIFVHADRLAEKASIPDHVRRVLERYSVEASDCGETSSRSRDAADPRSGGAVRR